MAEYRVRIESSSLVDPATWADANESVLDALLQAGAEATGWARFPRVGAVFAIDEPDVAAAAASAERRFRVALEATGVDVPAAYLEVGGDYDEAEPALVGVTDIAEIVGVSRQRIYQLVESDEHFPAPAVRLARGNMWRRAEIETWLAQRPFHRHSQDMEPKVDDISDGKAMLRAMGGG